MNTAQIEILPEKDEKNKRAAGGRFSATTVPQLQSPTNGLAYQAL